MELERHRDRADRAPVPAASAVFVVFRGVDDCRINGNTSKLHLHPALPAGLPEGFDDGEPGLEQDTDFWSLTLDYNVTEALTLSSITGYVDLRHWELDDYSYGAGVFGGLHQNVYRSLSQEQLSRELEANTSIHVAVFQSADPGFLSRTQMSI